MNRSTGYGLFGSSAPFSPFTESVTIDVMMKSENATTKNQSPRRSESGFPFMVVSS